MKTRRNSHPRIPANIYVDPIGRNRCRLCHNERQAMGRVATPRHELTPRQVKSMRDRVSDGVSLAVVAAGLGVHVKFVAEACADILKARAA